MEVNHSYTTVFRGWIDWPFGKKRDRSMPGLPFDVASRYIDKQDQEEAEGRNVSVPGCYYPNCLHPDKESSDFMFDHIKKVIVLQQVGYRHYEYFIGADSAKHGDDNFERFKRYGRRWISRRKNVKIGIENVPILSKMNGLQEIILLIPCFWRKIFETYLQEFWINYDPSHLLWQMMDYVKPSMIQRPYFSVHIKDAWL